MWDLGRILSNAQQLLTPALDVDCISWTHRDARTELLHVAVVPAQEGLRGCMTGIADVAHYPADRLAACQHICADTHLLGFMLRGLHAMKRGIEIIAISSCTQSRIWSAPSNVVFPLPDGPICMHRTVLLRPLCHCIMPHQVFSHHQGACWRSPGLPARRGRRTQTPLTTG